MKLQDAAIYISPLLVVTETKARKQGYLSKYEIRIPWYLFEEAQGSRNVQRSFYSSKNQVFRNYPYNSQLVLSRIGNSKFDFTTITYITPKRVSKRKTVPRARWLA